MADLQRIFDRISGRLNDALCEMKPGYDDSIVGFNEAWDIMRAVFKDELDKSQDGDVVNPGADGRPEQEANASSAKAANRRFDSSDRGRR